ncbi:MAG TPA: hypothetical protein VNM92_00565 [Thermoanaerobaculia bacterium]|nr:hypothetical protein [Thermoanaerobaculia bacterium]
MNKSGIAVGMTLVLILTQSACTSKPAADLVTSENAMTGNGDSGSGKSSGSITISGTLTDEGVECRAMRDGKTNELYTLTGNLSDFKTGDRVRVVGTIAEISICQQGRTISVSSVVRV